MSTTLEKIVTGLEQHGSYFPVENEVSHSIVNGINTILLNTQNLPNVPEQDSLKSNKESEEDEPKITTSQFEAISNAVLKNETEKALKLLNEYRHILSSPMNFFCLTKHLLKNAIEHCNVPIFNAIIAMAPPIDKWEWGFTCQTRGPAELPLVYALRFKDKKGCSEIIHTLYNLGASFKTWYSGDQDATVGVKEVLNTLSKPCRNAFLMSFNRIASKMDPSSKICFDVVNMANQVLKFADVKPKTNMNRG